MGLLVRQLAAWPDSRPVCGRRHTWPHLHVCVAALLASLSSGDGDAQPVAKRRRGTTQAATRAEILARLGSAAGADATAPNEPADSGDEGVTA